MGLVFLGLRVLCGTDREYLTHVITHPPDYDSRLPCLGQHAGDHSMRDFLCASQHVHSATDKCVGHVETDDVG